MAGYRGHRMDRIIEFLGKKPGLGGIGSSGGLIMSYIIRPDVQEFILFMMQFLVLVTSLVVGILTIIGWIRKNKNLHR